MPKQRKLRYWRVAKTRFSHYSLAEFHRSLCTANSGVNCLKNAALAGVVSAHKIGDRAKLDTGVFNFFEVSNPDSINSKSRRRWLRRFARSVCSFDLFEDHFKIGYSKVTLAPIRTWRWVHFLPWLAEVIP